MGDMVKVNARSVFEDGILSSGRPIWIKVGNDYKLIEFMDWHTEGTTWIGGKFDIFVKGDETLYMVDPYNDYLYIMDQATCTHDWELRFNGDKVEHVCTLCWLHRDATAPGTDIVTLKWNVTYSHFIPDRETEFLVEKDERVDKWAFIAVVDADDERNKFEHRSEPIYDTPEQAMCAAEVWLEVGD